MRKRRSRAVLLRAIEEAGSDNHRALAHFELALFHDNNGREAEALAWLASSLYKTGRPYDAMQRLAQSSAVAQDARLLRFLVGLERRIQRSLARE